MATKHRMKKLIVEAISLAYEAASQPSSMAVQLAEFTLQFLCHSCSTCICSQSRLPQLMTHRSTIA